MVLVQATPHLSAKERRCRRILDRTADYVVVVTESGTIDYVSPAVERLLGYAPDELIGTDAFEHVHSDDIELVRDDFETKLENPGVETGVTYRVRATDGEYRWAEARGRNYLDDPVIEGILLSVRDITDRKRKIEELIAELRRKYTIVIVTHNLQQAARVANYTAFFHMGRIVEYDETETMFVKPREKKTEDYITGRFG